MTPGGVTIETQIAEVRRELSARSQGLPRTGRASGLTPSQSDLCDGHLRAVLATLTAVRDGTLPPRS